MSLLVVTLFGGAFLLFSVQPLVAKALLPWYGGAAGVWLTCLVFFQVALLAGYGYAHLSVRLRPRASALLHVALLALSLLQLPVLPIAAEVPAAGQNPAWHILGTLLAMLAVPYVLLAANTPLLQAWLARTRPAQHVYRLFALSNLAALVALLAYPLLIEPALSLRTQGLLWSWGYAGYAALCAASALWLGASASGAAPLEPEAVAAPMPGTGATVMWVLLAALGTWLLLAVTGHITQNIAAMPFLWVVPLALYLFSFIACFDHDRWYRRSVVAPLAGLLVVLCAAGLQKPAYTNNLYFALPLYLSGLFMGCMLLHGELARRRPAAPALTRYYLAIAGGGALGGILVGVVAPLLLPAQVELGLGFVLTAILASIALRKTAFFSVITAIGVAGLCGHFWEQQIRDLRADTRVMVRDFYGALRTRNIVLEDGRTLRSLTHGTIIHGIQYLDPARAHEPLSYYGLSSGAGLVLSAPAAAGRRVGVVGLGAGTLAAYGRAGDTFRFYEINPQVAPIARAEFSYLSATPATVEIVPGDARLSLEREEPQDYDLLAVDAFSGDAVPAHLMTVEALQLYLRHLKPGGIIAFHVTNRYLDLAPAVTVTAQALGLQAITTMDVRGPGDYPLFSSDWVLVARDGTSLAPYAAAASPPREIPGLKPWRDDFNNLLQVVKR